MKNKDGLLCAILFTLGLVSCQGSSGNKPLPDTKPVWMLDSYSESNGFTFTKNMMVEYVTTCAEPDQVHTAKDAKNQLVFVSGGGCIDLIPVVGTFDQLSVTTSGTELTLAVNGREYHFKIRSVRSTFSKSDCNDQGHDVGNNDVN